MIRLELYDSREMTAPAAESAAAEAFELRPDGTLAELDHDGLWRETGQVGPGATLQRAGRTWARFGFTRTGARMLEISAGETQVAVETAFRSWAFESDPHLCYLMQTPRRLNVASVSLAGGGIELLANGETVTAPLRFGVPGWEFPELRAYDTDPAVRSAWTPLGS